MFVDIEEIVERGKKSCTIFIAEKITNLTFKNIGLFERALQGRHYVAVLPTFVNLNSE